jgi:hypothetical protein
MKEQEQIRVDVASIVFSITSSQNKLDYQMEKSYKQFLSTVQPEIFINIYYDGLTQFFLQDNNKVFDSEGPWSLYKFDKRKAIVCGESVPGLFPSRVALFDSDMKQVEIYSETERLPNGLLPDPLQYPLAEVLMICLLAQGRGLMVHACGIDDGGHGYIFAGNSTHGKSTMARLWKDKACVLNDDRIVLRKHEGKFWMYGTPWHGDYTAVVPKGILLEKVFFLNQEDVNSMSCVEGATAASKLLTRCFPPLWNEEGMNFTLDFCAQLVSDVPCYELGFVPDNKIVDFVRCAK